MKTSDFEDFVRVDNYPTPGEEHDVSSISGDVDSPPSQEDLIRILECPVCSEFPSPPIYSCEKGHFVCNTCLKILNACTTCQSPFGKVRNYALEAIVEKTSFTCKFKDEGCDLAVVGSGYLEHLSKCPYRPLQCREDEVALCHGVSYTREEYLTHLQSCHNAVSVGTPFSAVFAQALGGVFTSHFLRYQKKNGKYGPTTFILHSRKYKSFVCWWVSAVHRMDTPCHARLRWYLSPAEDDSVPASGLSKKAKGEAVITWKIPVQHENTSFSEVRDNGTCAVLPIQHLQQFGQNGREPRWLLRVEILNRSLHEEKHSSEPSASIVSLLNHYTPLLVLLAVGFSMFAYFCLEENKIEVRNESKTEYYGYRGFYFRNREDL